MEDVAGAVWTLTALDAANKLILSWLVGNRDAARAYEFMTYVAERVTDGFN